MKKSPIFHPSGRRPIVLILLVSTLFLSGCSYYKIVSVKEPPAITLANEQSSKTHFLHDSKNTWFIRDFAIVNDSIYGDFVKIYSYRQHAKKRFVSNRYHDSDSFFLNEIHLYTRDTAVKIQGLASLPVNAINWAEFYQDDRTKSTLVSVAGTLILVPTLVFGGIVDIVFITALFGGGSCPFIYTFDGNDYKFSGELYAGALYPQLERDDYLTLDYLAAVDGEYRISMRNELHEIQRTNLVELLVCDHPENTTVLADKHGQYQTITNPSSPLKATSLAGDDILPQLTNKDIHTYNGEISSEKIDIHEEIRLTFPRTESSDEAKLIIRAKNSLWLEHVYAELHKKMGFLYPVWTESRKDKDTEEMKKWSLDQNIPLSVFIERNGTWEFVDYFNVAGPMAMKDDVLSIDLTGTGDGPINIKLVTGNQFWEIDYVALDLSANTPPAVQRIYPVSAINQDGKDELPDLLADDDRYYVQPDIGNSAELIFPVPRQNGARRTIILHSKGWYQQLPQSNGIPRILGIKSFQNPDQLARFSNDLIEKAMSGLE